MTAEDKNTHVDRDYQCTLSLIEQRQIEGAQVVADKLASQGAIAYARHIEARIALARADLNEAQAKIAMPLN